MRSVTRWFVVLLIGVCLLAWATVGRAADRCDTLLTMAFVARTMAEEGIGAGPVAGVLYRMYRDVPPGVLIDMAALAVLADQPAAEFARGFYDRCHMSKPAVKTPARWTSP